MSESKQNRREFLEKVTMGVAGVGMAVSGNVLAALPAPAATGEMPYRTLGRSGEKVSLLGLGGSHIGKQADEQELDSLSARTAEAGRDGQFELFKTSPRFDGTVHNPSWLG